MKRTIDSYIRKEAFPTPFCPGCPDGIIGAAILRAIDKMGMDFDKMVFVSGIGCAGWIPSPHFAADTLHTTHGRPIAFATGVKLFRPDLTVVVISGDGDLASIGGNHLLHGVRRNIDLTVICVNNATYGLTGGQTAPTTPIGGITTTDLTGNKYRPFDICRLVSAAGAEYVSRYIAHQTLAIEKSFMKAVHHKGFSFIEIMSTCHVMYGRRNDREDPYEMLEEMKKNSVNINKTSTFTQEELGEKIIIGELVNANY